MKGTKKTVYDWFLVVEGGGAFPLDMLRYDSAFPFEQEDAAAMDWTGRRRRLVLVRRSVNEGPGTPGRWASFGWKVVAFTKDASEARQAASQGPTPVDRGIRAPDGD